MTARLVAPTTDLHAAFLSCRAEWGPGLHEDGFGIRVDDDLDSPGGFAAWIAGHHRTAHEPGTPCPAGQHATFRWIVEDDRVLGGIALRHHYDGELGQIGYGIRPTARRRGLAGQALTAILAEARAYPGISRVALVCLDDNTPSIRTIEQTGATLDTLTDTPHGRLRRYVLPTPA